MAGGRSSDLDLGISDQDGRQPNPSAKTIDSIHRRTVAAVRRTCPSWMRTEADDIVQNVLIQVLDSLKKSEGQKQFSAMYLQRAVYGKTMDQVRLRYRRKETPVELHENQNPVSSPNPGPEQQSAAREIADGIRDCLIRLMRPRRLAVTLYLQGCSVPRAAMHLAWTLKKTENLTYRGLGDLRKCLSGKGLEP